MVKITDIDWSNVRMDPMAGSGYPPCERNAVYSEKAPVRKAPIVLRRVLNITIWAILLIGGIVLGYIWNLLINAILGVFGFDITFDARLYTSRLLFLI